jgi:hypothetical protein
MGVVLNTGKTGGCVILGVAVGNGVGTNVAEAVGNGVMTGLDETVTIGVRIGPDNCPVPQLDVNKLRMKQIIAS